MRTAIFVGLGLIAVAIGNMEFISNILLGDILATIILVFILGGFIIADVVEFLDPN